MKSWKTTLCGILSVIASGITLVVLPLLDADPATVPNWGAFAAALTAGVGLILARDNDKTSESVGAK
ncbi:MAG: hypothetical protein N3A38_06340 [Planctomycetota bacterium]|nr:hypothetical protein [Planctomycetota bacterium]